MACGETRGESVISLCVPVLGHSPDLTLTTTLLQHSFVWRGDLEHPQCIPEGSNLKELSWVSELLSSMSCPFPASSSQIAQEKGQISPANSSLCPPTGKHLPAAQDSGCQGWSIHHTDMWWFWWPHGELPSLWLKKQGQHLTNRNFPHHKTGKTYWSWFIITIRMLSRAFRIFSSR